MQGIVPQCQRRFRAFGRGMRENRQISAGVETFEPVWFQVRVKTVNWAVFHCAGSVPPTGKNRSSRARSKTGIVMRRVGATVSFRSRLIPFVILLRLCFQLIGLVFGWEFAGLHLIRIGGNRTLNLRPQITINLDEFRRPRV